MRSALSASNLTISADPDSTSSAQTSRSNSISEEIKAETGIRKKCSAKKKVARSRFGCEACRDKRVKCDETRPSCKRCVEKGSKCTYKFTLQFRDDLEKKGKKFGREGVWQKKKSHDTTTELAVKASDSYYLQVWNSNNLMFVNYNNADVDHPRLVPSVQPSIIPHDILNNLVYHRSPSYALNYYIDFVAPIFNPITRNSSHYIEEVVLHGSRLKIQKGLNLNSLMQYSQNYHHVFYLMLSLGSIYLSKYQSNDKVWDLQAQEYQSLGIATIRNKLSQIQVEEDPEVTTDILMSLVLMIMYQIADDCNEKWSAYLKVCTKLRDSKNLILPSNPLEKSLLRFCLQFLHYQESMGRTACKEKNSLFMTLENLETEECTDEKVISWMGCEVGLVDVIDDITDLSFERQNKGIAESNYKILSDNIKTKLERMKLNIDVEKSFVDLGELDTSEEFRNSELILIDPALDIEQFCFILASEIKTIAGEIYLNCCLLSKSPQDKDVAQQIKALSKMLKFIILRNDFKWCSTLLWPIFIVGVEIDNHDADSESLRYLVLELLEKLDTYGLGNANKAREVIMKVWKKRDLDDSDDNSLGATTSFNKKGADGGSRNLGFVNDWEQYVFDANLKLSLA